MDRTQYLQMMQQQQGMNQPQGQPLPTSNPLMSGSNAAMQSIQQSSQNSDHGRRSALGSALVSLGSGMAKPQNYQGEGLNGVLSALNASFPQAYDSYNQEQDRARQQQLEEYQMQMKIADMQQRQAMASQRYRDLQEYRHRMLSQKESRSTKHSGSGGRGTDIELQHQKHIRGLNSDATKLIKERSQAIEKAVKAMPSMDKYAPDAEERIKKVVSEIDEKFKPRREAIEKGLAFYEKRHEKPKTGKDHQSEINKEYESIIGQPEAVQETPNPYAEKSNEELEAMLSAEGAS